MFHYKQFNRSLAQYCSDMLEPCDPGTAHELILRHFIARPYNNARAIVGKLIRTAGEGNFDSLAKIDEPKDL